MYIIFWKLLEPTVWAVYGWFVKERIHNSGTESKMLLGFAALFLMSWKYLTVSFDFQSFHFSFFSFPHLTYSVESQQGVNIKMMWFPSVTQNLSLPKTNCDKDTSWWLALDSRLMLEGMQKKYEMQQWLKGGSHSGWSWGCDCWEEKNRNSQNEGGDFFFNRGDGFGEMAVLFFLFLSDM